MPTPTTSKPRPRRVSPDRRIERLEDQLAKRMRFAWLMFIFGTLAGAVFTAIISAPPVWMEAM